MNKTESYALTLAEIVSELQNKIIINRKRLFENAVKSGIGFKAGITAQMQDYNEIIDKLFNEALGESKVVVSKDLAKSYAEGEKSIDFAVGKLQEQGVELEKQEVTDSVLSGLTERAMFELLVVLSVMKYTQADELKRIVSGVNERAENIYSEIDRVQAPYLNEGATGKILPNGVHKSAEAEVEFLMRNEGQEAVRLGQAKQMNVYNMQPLVKLVAQPNACPQCLPYRDAILIDDVNQNGMADNQHTLLSDAIADGLFHYNCRCNLMPYIPSHDIPEFFERDKRTIEEASKGYAYEQRQRQIERSIRQWKRRANGSFDELQARNADNKVAEWQELQRALFKKADNEGITLIRQYNREKSNFVYKSLLRKI